MGGYTSKSAVGHIFSPFMLSTVSPLIFPNTPTWFRSIQIPAHLPNSDDISLEEGNSTGPFGAFSGI